MLSKVGMRGKDGGKNALSCTLLIVHHGYGVSKPFPVFICVSQIILLQIHGRREEMFTVLLPCVLQKGHRLPVLAVLKLRLYQVCTASAVKSFRIFLVSGFCTRAYSAGYHSGLMTSITRYCSCWRKNELTERQCTLLLQTGL